MGKKILVVDYDQSTLASLEQILSKEGYEVILAGDGQAAWDKYNQDDPDLVLMEAMLSKIHGFELCQRITSVHERRVPVFIMTGVYKDRVYRTEALRSYGASEYFEKPLKIAEILASIEASIGKPKPEPVPEPEPDPDLAPGYAEAAAASAMMQGAGRAERSDPEPAAEPAFAGAPASASAMQEVVPSMPRKPEKPKPAERDNGWAFDLEQLEKDIPKIMSDPPARSGKDMDARSKPAEDEIDLVAAALESLPKVTAEPARSNKNNGNDGLDIDNILKSALADLDISGEKAKAPEKPKAVRPAATPPPLKPKPAVHAAAPHVEKPRPAPPPPPPPVEKPRPVPPRERVAPTPAVERAKPTAQRDTPPPAPPSPAARPAERPAERPRAVPPASTPAAAPVVPPAAATRPAVKKEEERRAPSWERPAPAEPPDELRRSVIEDAKLRQRIPTGLFDEVQTDKPRAGLPVIIAGGAAVVILAVAGFLLLRPKPQPSMPVSVPAAAVEAVDQPAAQPPAVEEQAPETTPPPAPEQKPVPKPPAAKATAAAGNGAVRQKPEAAEDAAGLIAPITPVANPGLALQLPDDLKPEEKKAEPPPAKTQTAPPPTVVPEEVRSDPVVQPPSAPPAPVKEGDLIDLTEVDIPPAVAKRVEPVYPQAALRLGIEGVITVNALIDETGKVIDTAILRGMKDDRGLEKAAQTAVKKWRFDPARKSGVNVKVWMPVVIVFKVGDNEGQTTR
jgi:TonB family protein